jgi:inorganic triphosphatase YgiF
MPETELKILVQGSPEALRSRLRKLKAAGVSRTRTLRSIYFDTPDHALRKADIALRLRRDGRRWIQTVKTGRMGGSGFSRVGEVEVDAPGGRLNVDAIPDSVVRVEVLGVLGEATPQPVCETVITRTTRSVTFGATTAEIAIDRGAISAGGRSAEIVELEIELLDGDPQGLFEIAKMLFPEGGLRFSRMSKSARGYLLAEKGFVDPPPVPRNAAAVPLSRDMTAEEGVRDILRECIEQVIANIDAVRSLDDPEGPHQLRVGLRRLRSLFTIFEPLARSAELERLGSEARWLGREVGRLRDLDVAAGEILAREAAAHPQEPSLAALLGRLEDGAAAERLHLRTVLEGRRVQDLSLDLIRFVETRGWLTPDDIDQTARLASPVLDMAGMALGECWRKVRRRARKLDAATIEQRHALRKALKQLRYAIEFLGPLYEPRRVGPVIKRLKGLQEVFGALNDAAMVKTIVDDPNRASTDDPVAQRGAGWVLGASEARAELSWHEARGQWRRLRKTRLFWK